MFFTEEILRGSGIKKVLEEGLQALKITSWKESFNPGYLNFIIIAIFIIIFFIYATYMSIFCLFI